MIKKMMALLLVIGITIMLIYPATALKITKNEREVFTYDKDETIKIEIWVEVEDENETGKYKLEVEDKSPFTWVDDDNDDSEDIDTPGEARLLVVEAEADDPSDGKYLFTYHIYRVVDGNETEVETGTFEVEIGKGDGSCGMVFFAIPLVGLIALVALVRRK